MHDMDFDHEHAKMTDADRAALARAIWEQETVELTTVGIDIGSSTSHLLFARVILQRQTQGLSSRFVVIDRHVVWRSPIMLTPFLRDGTIDADALRVFVNGAYEQAGYTPDKIDSGAVILTGEAIKRKNARAIDEIFATEAGKFVCATAGHKLECILAAHGSGAVALSRQREATILHIDIGGGTTKLALINNGVILGVMAFAVGGRLVAQDATGQWTRVDDSAVLVAKELGIATDPVTLSDVENRTRIAKRLAQIAADYVLGAPLDDLGRALQLTDAIPRDSAPVAFTFSGGVAEYIFTYEEHEFGDIAKPLARELTQQLGLRGRIPLIDPGQRIRATVIGASQFTVQVSGKTIYLADPSVLPVHNIPVVHLGMSLEGDLKVDAIAEGFLKAASLMDLESGARLALAFTWAGDPEYSRLATMAKAIMKAFAPTGKRDEMLVLMIDGDVGRTLGRILDKELHLDSKLVSIDGMQLQELDFVDIGELYDPPGVVPVVIKSLLFS